MLKEWMIWTICFGIVLLAVAFYHDRVTSLSDYAAVVIGSCVLGTIMWWRYEWFPEFLFRLIERKNRTEDKE